jgi:hypothetical protein
MNGPWQPANETEAAMARALVAGDRQQFFGVIATADLYLPQVVQEEADGQTFITGQFAGRTVLPVFTSVEALVAVAGGYTVTGYTELREKWPNPEWLLAVNPGCPIDACLPIGSVDAAARGGVASQTMAEAIVDALAENPEAAADLLDTDHALHTAATRGDAVAVVETLLGSTVVVPTAGEMADPEAVLTAEAPWLITGAPDAPLIEVFTSVDAFHAACDPPPPSVSLSLVLLLTIWPEDVGMAVNPRTPIALSLSSEQVIALLLWTVNIDGDELPEEAAQE